MVESPVSNDNASTIRRYPAVTTRILAMTIEDFRTADSGSRIRDYHLCSTLTEYGEVDVLAFTPDSVAASAPRPFSGHVLVDDRKPAALSAFESVTRRSQFHASRFDPTSHRDFAVCAGRRYDLIYCSILYSIPAAIRLTSSGPSAGAPILWDTHNYDPDVFRSIAEGAAGPRRIAISSQIRLAEKATVAAANAATTVIACTSADAARFEPLAADVRLVPNAAEVDAWWSAGLAQVPDPFTVVIFGSLQRDSTWRGVRWMISEVWPIVRGAEPRSQLIVAGRSPSDALQLLVSNTEGARLVANPADLRSVACRAQVIAVPEVWGTGSKLKMAESLASTRPVVATSSAVTGLDEHLTRYVERADTPEAFATAILASYDAQEQPPNAELLRDLRQHADWTSSQARLRRIIDDALLSNTE